VNILQGRNGASYSARQRASFIAVIACYFASPSVAVAVSGDSAPASGSSLLQVMLGLGLVLIVMAGFVWLLKRFRSMQPGSGDTIKIIGGSVVGQRERIVLVEVADTWLVVGVAPGHVTALHSMPKGEIASSISHPVGTTKTDSRFSNWLRHVTEKQKWDEQRVR
jgi:flagellar protein FliO/FliZ